MRQMVKSSAGTPLKAYAAAYASSRRLRLAEDRAAAARIDAEQANAAKAAFLSGLNHELRTPLNGITGFAGLLRENDDLGREKRIEYLDHILHSAGVLLERIDAILRAAAGSDSSGRHGGEGTDPLPVLRRVLQEHAGKVFVGKADIADDLPPVTTTVRDLYQALGRVFAALSVGAPARRAVGLAVAAAEGGRDVAITFRLLSGEDGLSVSARRSLNAEVIRLGLRLEEPSAHSGREIILLAPAQARRTAA